MKKSLLNYLACPDCQGDIAGDFEEELETGELHCLQCQRQFPVALGVPTLLPLRGDQLAAQVAAEFGEQWQRYDHQRPEYRQQFLDWIHPVDPDFFRDKVVLDGGCGKGRHLLASAEFDPKLVIGVDLGEAIYVARESTRHTENVQVVRGDLLCLPFKDGVFDFAYSVGVLHHLPEPRAGFDSLVRKIRPTGHIAAWVYGLENNQWIVNMVNPIRENITNRLPRPLLKALSQVLAAVILLVTRAVYQPWNRRFPNSPLFYQEYLLYIAKFPFQEIETIVYDQLNPKVAHYLPRQQFEGWFNKLEQVCINWHNRNSWRGFARIPDSES